MRKGCFISMAFVLICTLGSVAFAQIDKFEIHCSKIELAGEPSQNRYFDVVGRGAFLMGSEGGVMEAWITPFKIAHDIRLTFDRNDFPEPKSSESLARWIRVNPDHTAIRYAYEEFGVTAYYFVPVNEPAIIILLEAEGSQPFTVSCSFKPDLQPMWPAALGGQYARWDGEHKAFLFSESRRRYNALFGSPAAVRSFRTPAHRISESPNRFEIDIDPAKSAGKFIPIIIAGGMMERDAAYALYQRVLENIPALYAERHAHAVKLQNDRLSIDSPDDDLDRALEWSKVALDDGMSTNPGLGTGIVAGYGISGLSTRPGFAWFFGVDTFFNQFSMIGYGDYENIKTALELIRKNQREDGKIMHELSQGAPFLKWFEDYPYGYFHIETSPYYILAVMNYVNASGDLEFLKESWPSMQAAYKFIVSTDTDGDGLPENSAGGLGALEVGVLLKDLKTDIYVAGIWVGSLYAMRDAAQFMDDEKLADECTQRLEKAKAAVAKLFWNPDIGFHALAIATDGTAVSELTAWPSLPMLFRALPEEEAQATLRKLSSPEIATDYGIRMLTNTSSAYEPTAYNNGAAWPFLSGYVAMAQYQYHRPIAGWQIIDGLKNLVFSDSRGDIAELYTGDRYRPLDAAVGHQLFSSGGFVYPLIRGALGVDPNAVHKRLNFWPRWPFEWENLTIDNVRLGDGKLRIQYERKGGLQIYTLTGDSQGWDLHFFPQYPLGTEIESVTIDGEPAEFRVREWPTSVALNVRAKLNGNTKIEVKLNKAYSLKPLTKPVPGEPSQSLRFIDCSKKGDAVVYRFAGIRGLTYRVKLTSLAGTKELKLAIPSGEGQWGEGKVQLNLQEFDYKTQ